MMGQSLVGPAKRESIRNTRVARKKQVGAQLARKAVRPQHGMFHELAILLALESAQARWIDLLRAPGLCPFCGRSLRRGGLVD